MTFVRFAFALVVLAAAPARAQADAPVILVHGLTSNDLAWEDAVVHLESLGFGTPYSYHFDLNASTSTRAEEDVVGPAIVPFWEYASPNPARFGGGQVPDSLALSFDVDAPPARAVKGEGGGTPLVLVNFETWYDWDEDTIWVHGTRGVSGHSESNCSAIAKQGYALGLVVADVLDWTGADRVILMGHSMGGLAIREYLQRRDPDGTPRWWADPTQQQGHGVAAAVTYGTPHQGSNLVNFGFFCADTEATRDLRYSYISTGEVAPYLYGGDEDIQAYWHNNDVNADGVEGGPVAGLNWGDPSEPYSPDNPAMPLPPEVAYTYIYSLSSLTGTGDGVVSGPRQLVQFLGTDGNPYVSPVGSARAIRRDVGHASQTEDYEMVAWAVQNALWLPTSTDPEPGVPESVEVTIGPNPAPGRTTASLRLSRPGEVTVSVVDVLGRTVMSHDLGLRSAGEVRAPLDLEGLAPGVYLVRTLVGERSAPAVPITVVR